LTESKLINTNFKCWNSTFRILSLLSSLYRSSKLTRPNQTVLDAQTKVCTGPTQSKPLDEEEAFKVFDTILRSGFSFFLSFLSLNCVYNHNKISKAMFVLIEGNGIEFETMIG